MYRNSRKQCSFRIQILKSSIELERKLGYSAFCIPAEHCTSASMRVGNPFSLKMGGKMPKSIAVAGKGGTGKTTIAALIILCLREKGMGPVLAIDSDPDSNLGTLLGIKPEQTLGDLRNEVLEELKDLPAGMTKANYFEAGLHQVIEESEGFDLITMGKGEGPGCYCYLNNLIRKFYEDLMPSYEWIVVDNEAGLEHISRRTTSNIDSLIIVVNQNPISFHTAERIAEITGKLKNEIRKKYIVSNMINDKWKKEMQNRVSQLNMEYLCDIPYDPLLEEIIFKGEPLTELKDTPIKNCINSIIETVAKNK